MALKKKKAKNPIERLCICNDYLGGMTGDEIARKYGISRKTVINYMQNYRKDYASLLSFLIDMVNFLHDNGEWKAGDLLYERRFELLKAKVGAEHINLTTVENELPNITPITDTGSADFEQVFQAPPINDIDI